MQLSSLKLRFKKIKKCHLRIDIPDMNFAEIRDALKNAVIPVVESVGSHSHNDNNCKNDIIQEFINITLSEYYVEHFRQSKLKSVSKKGKKPKVEKLLKKKGCLELIFDFVYNSDMSPYIQPFIIEFVIVLMKRLAKLLDKEISNKKEETKKQTEYEYEQTKDTKSGAITITYGNIKITLLNPREKSKISITIE